MTPDFWQKLGKVGKGALFAGAGTVLTWALQHVTRTDFGTYAVLVAFVLAVASNALSKWTIEAGYADAAQKPVAVPGVTPEGPKPAP